VAIGVGSAGPVRLTIATPVALSGSTLSGSFAANAGEIHATATDQDLVTATTINGADATVSGDTDRNGSLDLVFSTTLAALLAQ
jgi:hypothetical protein